MDKTNVKVEFCIFGDEFDPSNITQNLNIEPNQTHIKAEPIPHRKNLFWKETLWEINTDYEECYDINHILRKILDKILDKTDILLSIKKMYDVEMKFYIVIVIENNETPGMGLNQETIEFMGKIGSSIDFDIYINPPLPTL